MLLTDLREEHLINLKVLGRAKGTVWNHEYSTGLLLEFLKQEYQITKVEQVKPAHIRAIMLLWHEEKGWTGRTVNKMVGILKVMFNYAVDEEYLDEFKNPTRKIKNVTETKTVIETFTDEEVKNILNSFHEKTYSNIRDKLLLMMLFDMGLRVSELIAITPEDVRETNILIHGKGSKERVLYISPVIKRQLIKFKISKKDRFKHKHHSELDNYLFLNQEGKKMSRSRINKILNEHADLAKVRKSIRVSPHTCRHYFAHAQLRNGQNVYNLSRLMGHYDTRISTEYLRGITDEEVVESGIKTSPLSNL